MRWTVVIPIKSLPAAKSRLAAASLDAPGHRALVEALRRDTIDAVDAADDVARILLVTDADLGAANPPNGPRRAHVVQQRAGLNGALRDGAEHAAATWPEDGVALLVGDLPALRPAELVGALAVAATMPGPGFVRDAEGVGTTMLAGRSGLALEPRFGPNSARRHGDIATVLDAGAGLRRDVDTPDDLWSAATELGVGPATAALLARRVPAPPVHLGLG